MSLEKVSTTLQEIAELARHHDVLSTLAHRLDEELLSEAYRRTRKDGAVGVDAVTWQKYGEKLKENLNHLIGRLKEDRYRAQPVRRVQIPKEDGKKRPLGIPTLEDKVLQKAVKMLIEPVYEQMFKESSYGFRPKRTAHEALDAIKEGFHQQRVTWVLDADLKDYFGSIDHKHLQDFISRRVNDGKIKRLIGKWLNAGILEDETLKYLEVGTPQGGVISPLLGNIYLHYVLDEWFEDEVKPRLRGQALLVRYADDFVIGFEHREDADRVLEVIHKRMSRYGLTLHQEKTKLVRFGEEHDDDDTTGKFDFLGFTHYRKRSARTGRWYTSRKTSSKRQARTIKRIWQWCKKVRHHPIEYQYKKLCQKLAGYYPYYNLWDNKKRVNAIPWWAAHAWRYWLNRRGGKTISWQRFRALLKTIFPLPLPPIVQRVAKGHA